MDIRRNEFSSPELRQPLSRGAELIARAREAQPFDDEKTISENDRRALIAWYDTALDHINMLRKPRYDPKLEKIFNLSPDDDAIGKATRIRQADNETARELKREYGDLWWGRSKAESGETAPVIERQGTTLRLTDGKLRTTYFIDEQGRPTRTREGPGCDDLTITIVNRDGSTDTRTLICIPDRPSQGEGEGVFEEIHAPPRNSAEES
jgi:hypothetical protein